MAGTDELMLFLVIIDETSEVRAGSGEHVRAFGR
jgi:hypothetical protein